MLQRIVVVAAALALPALAKEVRKGRPKAVSSFLPYWHFLTVVVVITG